MADETKEEQLSYEEYTKQQEAGAAPILDEGDPDRVMADENIPFHEDGELGKRPEPQPEPAKPEEKVVPLAALHEERQRRQKLDEELRQQRELNLKLMQTLEKPAKEQEHTEPQYYDDDAVTVKTLKELVPTLIPKTPEQVNVVAIETTVRNVLDEREARAIHTDYNEVIAPFEPILRSSLPLQEEVMARAKRTGKSIIETAYQMAKAWRETPVDSLPPKSGTPTALTAAQLIAQGQKIANQERQPATAGHSGDSSPANPMNIEALLALSADEFSRVVNTLSPAQLRKLSGG